MSYLLECRNLTKFYGSKKALNGINLTLDRGRICGLLGPNGSGKTTLIKLINGIITPTGGSLLVNGMAPGIESKLSVSYLPERTYLDNTLTVESTLRYFSDFYSNFNKDKAYEMLARLNIGKNDRLKNMSKGTKEKVQLILVMSREADLYCLDEPIGGVDPAARDYILDTILTNYSKNATILISTHLISDIENILDEVVFINQGDITAHTSTAHIKETMGKTVDEYFREVYKC